MLGVWVLWFEFWGLGGLGGMQPINVPAAIIEFLSGVWQPNAAQHLAAAAQSNMQCVYLPHPRVPLHWFAHRLHSAISGVCLNTSFCSIASVSIHKPARPSRLRRVSRPTILHPSIHPSSVFCVAVAQHLPPLPGPSSTTLTRQLNLVHLLDLTQIPLQCFVVARTCAPIFSSVDGSIWSPNFVIFRTASKGFLLGGSAG